MEQHAGVDLRRQLEPYWRRRWLVLFIVVMLPVAVYAYSKTAPETYATSTTMLVRETSVSSSLFGNSYVTTGSAEDALTLLHTTAVGRKAAKELGLPADQAGTLLNQITAEFASGDASGTTGSEFITITAEDGDPVRAADIANAFAAAVGATRSGDASREIRLTIAALQRQRDALDRGETDVATIQEFGRQLQELRGLLASQEGSTRVIEPAGVPSTPISPRPRRNAALALVVAILLAAGVVPLADALNRRLRDPDELEPLLGAPMLAQIPAGAFPGSASGPHVLESFQTLRASLTYFNLDRELQLILIASPGHGEGKTTVATNLASSMARDGHDVILVDGDLRKPRAAERLGVSVPVGVEGALTADVDLDRALQRADVGGGSLRVLGNAGPARSASTLLGSRKMRNLLEELVRRSSLVIVDTPPLLAVSDAIPLFKQASGAILVGRVNRTHTAALRKSRDVIAAAGGTLLGTVATGSKAAGLYGRYGGYSDYYVSEGEEEATGGESNGEPSVGQRLRDRIGRR